MKNTVFPINNCRIVLPSDALPGLVDAARFLAGVAADSIRCELPIITDKSPAEGYELVLGRTDRDSEATASALSEVMDDGFAILVDGTRLHITAHLTRGVVYGIYAFAEDYIGARYLSSRDRFVSPVGEAKVPADLRRIDNPGFMSRDVFWYDLLHPAEDSDFDFPCAMRSNHGEMPHVGGGVSYAGGLVHTLPDLAGTAHEPGVQPCLSDENTFVTVRKNVIKWLEENPEAKIISVSQNDSYAEQLGCQCDACRAIDEREGTPMGSLLTFVNRIADSIKDDYPDVWVDTLAYRYTRKAPRTVVPADNVLIRLCSIECCFSHPLDDPSCPHNVAFVKDIEEWSAICKHLYIWDYTTDFLFYLSPFPNLDVLRRNVRFFKAHNVIGMFEQGNYESLSGELGELRAYLLSRLLWNPDMTEEEYNTHMDRFLADYYGKGWQSIRAYIDETCRAAADRHMHIYDHPHTILPLGEENCLSDHYLALWDMALAAAETDAERRHCRTGRIQALHHSTFSDTPAPAQTERLAEMHAAIREAGITRFREGTPIPDASDPEALPLLH